MKRGYLVLCYLVCGSVALSWSANWLYPALEVDSNTVVIIALLGYLVMGAPLPKRQEVAPDGS